MKPNKPLMKLAKQINKTCFGGRLPAIPIYRKKLPGDPAIPEEQYAYFCSNKQLKKSTRRKLGANSPHIVVNSRYLCKYDLIKILIHEMTHLEDWWNGKFYAKAHWKDIENHSKSFFMRVCSREIDYSMKHGFRLDKLKDQWGYF